jgi:hypothetical protein
MRENRLHIRFISIVSVILVVILSYNFHNSFQEPRLQTYTNISVQIIPCQSTMMNSTSKKMSTIELGQPLNGIPTNVKRYVDQLSNSSSSEIANFPINDLSSEKTTNVLCGLSVQNLYKVLKSISVDDLSTLFQRLSPDQVKEILAKLPANQVKEILAKLPANQKKDIQSRITS